MMRRTLVVGTLALALALDGSAPCSAAEKSRPAEPPLDRYDARLRKAASWLLGQANADGSFGQHAKVGMTGLALSALLSAPQADELRRHSVVTKAADYLVSMQQPDGSINEAGQKGLANYQTSAALSALIRLGNPAHKKAIEKARKFLVDIQRSDGLNAGGWGYNSAKRADLSNTQMTLNALRAAGLDEDSEAFTNCLAFLQRCQNRSESNDQPYAGNDGGAMYYPGNSKAGTVTLPNGRVVHQSYGSMTYALLRCYLLVGLQSDDPRVVAAQKWLADHYTVERNPGLGKQGLYYYYMTMAEALSLLDSPRVEAPGGKVLPWARDLADQLLARQADDGHWVNAEMRWMENDPILATSYAMLALRRCRDLLAKR